MTDLSMTARHASKRLINRLARELALEAGTTVIEVTPAGTSIYGFATAKDVTPPKENIPPKNITRKITAG